MQIDNREEAQDLCDRLEATIPFPVRVGKQLLKTMIDGGNNASLDDVLLWIGLSILAILAVSIAPLNIPKGENDMRSL